MKRILSVFALVAAAAAPAAAQGRAPICPTGTASEQLAANACELGVDLFRYMAPQLGTAVAGGNATLGQGGTLGGLGHFVVGVRANAVMGTLPQADKIQASYTGRSADTLATTAQVLPMPTVDAAIGVFKGLPLGVTSVGGIDLLVNASYIPEYSGSNVELTAPNGSLQLGFGARLGLLQESLVVPGLSVSYMVRDLPTLNLTGSDGNGSQMSVEGFQVKTRAWRATASKNLLILGLAVGAGQDTYSSQATVQGSATQGGLGYASDRIAMEQKLTRTNYFVDASMNLMVLKLVGEIGMVQGGTVETFNQFADKAADASRMYGSVGVRVGF